MFSIDLFNISLDHFIKFYKELTQSGNLITDILIIVNE